MGLDDLDLQWIPRCNWEERSWAQRRLADSVDHIALRTLRSTRRTDVQLDEGRLHGKGRLRLGVVLHAG